MSWGLALRIVKWSLFVVVFMFASSPRTHGVPDPTYLCMQGTCYRVVISPPQQPDQDAGEDADHGYAQVEPE